MTEERPHFRTENPTKTPVFVTLSRRPLSREQREALQLRDFPNTTFGRAALTCYSIDPAKQNEKTSSSETDEQAPAESPQD